MSTDDELGADKAYTVGAEETAVKNNRILLVVCVKPLILGHLGGSEIGNSPAIGINLNKCMWLR